MRKSLNSAKTALHARGHASVGQSEAPITDAYSLDSAYPSLLEELQELYHDGAFDVVEEIEAAFGHEAAAKWPRKDVYVRKWLAREAENSQGRSQRATRGKANTDWNSEFGSGRGRATRGQPNTDWKRTFGGGTIE